ncbi:MAG: hypothetical protein WBE13_02580 [Candidatus Acidiferrum sp.]
MLRASDKDSLCIRHLRQAAASQPDPEALAAELLGEIEDFATADSVNFFLGNLVRQLARKRIERRDAIALAYICQLLLNSLSPLKEEIRGEDGGEESMSLHNAFVAQLQSKMRGDPDSRNGADSPAETIAPAPPRDYASVRT